MLRNGISPEELVLPPAGNFRKRHPQIGDKTLLLFLGRIDYRGKGTGLAAGCIQQVKQKFPDIHLVLAGPSERDGMQQTQQRVEALN